jgi:hypothetical protein
MIRNVRRNTLPVLLNIDPTAFAKGIARNRRRTNDRHIKARRSKVIERDGMVCRVCGVLLCCWERSCPGRAQIDHVIPVALGGQHDVGDLRVICSPCNYQNAPEKILAAWLAAGLPIDAIRLFVVSGFEGVACHNEIITMLGGQGVNIDLFYQGCLPDRPMPLTQVAS